MNPHYEDTCECPSCMAYKKMAKELEEAHPASDHILLLGESLRLYCQNCCATNSQMDDEVTLGRFEEIAVEFEEEHSACKARVMEKLLFYGTVNGRVAVDSAGRSDRGYSATGSPMAAQFIIGDRMRVYAIWSNEKWTFSVGPAHPGVELPPWVVGYEFDSEGSMQLQIEIPVGLSVFQE